MYGDLITNSVRQPDTFLRLLIFRATRLLQITRAIYHFSNDGQVLGKELSTATADGLKQLQMVIRLSGARIIFIHSVLPRLHQRHHHISGRLRAALQRRSIMAGGVNYTNNQSKPIHQKHLLWVF